MRLYLTIFLTILLRLPVAAQTKINYDLLNRPFSLPVITPSTPQSAQFVPIGSFPDQKQNYSVLQTGPTFNLNFNQVQQQNQQLMQQGSTAMPGLPIDNDLASTRASVESDIDAFVHPQTNNKVGINDESYNIAFNQLMQLDPNNFSLAKAVYTVESAYFDNKLSSNMFIQQLQQTAGVVRQILKREGLNAKSNLAVNYAIQKLYQQDNQFYNAQHQLWILKQFKYDFDDFRGEKDYTKMFASKMLATGKGQCHSGPLVYLLIAEQLGAKAYLSLAPQHSFIRFSDAAGSIHNFETTNGHIVSESWLIQSGYIAAKALQNKTYLDTLSQKQLFAQVLGDLLLGYLAKYHRYDGFANQVRQAILNINPNNLTALIVGANLKVMEARQKIKDAGMPKPDDLPKYPEAYKAYLGMKAELAKVDNLGYQDMPGEEYKKWLKSVEEAKQQQQSDELKANMQREIQQLKKFQADLQKQRKQ